MLQWEGTAYRGIACDMTSVGFKALSEATREVIGECKPYAETGALVSDTCHILQGLTLTNHVTANERC